MNLAMVYPLSPATTGNASWSRRQRRSAGYQVILDAADAAGRHLDTSLMRQAMTATVKGIDPHAQLHVEILRAGAGTTVFIVAEVSTAAAPALARAALYAACQMILAYPARFGLSHASVTTALANWKETTDD